MAKEKIPVSQMEYNELMDLWRRACLYEGKDPNLEGALYIFDEMNPHYQEYLRKREYYMKRNQ